MTNSKLSINKTFTTKNIIFYLSFIYCLITFSINITLLFKNIYYFDIKFLNLENLSSLSYEQLKHNYNYLINFLYSTTYNFKMPYFISSKEGTTHFFEVRNVIQNMNLGMFIFLPITIYNFAKKYKQKEFKFIRNFSVISLIIPFVLTIPILINFNFTFKIFHKILFNNNYWLFDPIKDPVINVLPETFFFHEGIFILSIFLLYSLLFFMIYSMSLKKNEKK